MTDLTNQEKAKYIFDVLSRHRETISNFSNVTQISRPTLHAWKRGETIGDKIRLGIAYRAAQKLDEGM